MFTSGRAALLLLIVTAALYAPSLGYPYVYEDLNDPSRWIEPMPLSVMHHLRLGAGGRIVSLMTFEAGHALSGAEPWGHHVISIGLHLLNGALVYALALAVLPAWGAVFVMGLFLLHPVQVESVAYLSARPDLVSTCCLLIALLLTEVRGYALAWVMCAAAVLAKETAVVSFLLVPLWALWRGRRDWELIPWALGVAVPLAWVSLRFPPTIDLSGATSNLREALGLLSLWIVPSPLTIDHAWTTWRVGLTAGVLLVAGWRSRVVRAASAWALVTVLPRCVVLLLEGLHEHHLYSISVALSLGAGLLCYGVTRQESYVTRQYRLSPLSV